MKRLITLGLVFLLFVVAHAEVTKTYDRFTQRTTVKSDVSTEKVLSGRFSLLLLCSFEGEVVKEAPNAISASFHYLAEGKYFDCSEAWMLVDGEPMGELEEEWDDNVGRILGCVTLRLPFSTVIRMAQAQKVEMKICNDEFELDEEEMSDLRDFVAALRVVEKECFTVSW
jgi:hypothetical protein